MSSPQTIGPYVLIPLALAACDRGRTATREDTATMASAGEVVDQKEDEPSLPAVVIDPDDEAFHESDADSASATSPEGQGDGGDEATGPVFTIKGMLKSVDEKSGLMIVDQLLGDGRRHDVRFWTDEQTVMGWSKASMKMTLTQLPRGITLYVTYHVVGQGADRRNRAIKVIIPGGMEDVAHMILGDPEKTASTHEKASKPPKKH